MNEWRIEHLGPGAVVIRFGDEISERLVPLIRAAQEQLAEGLLPYGIVRDLVPSYTTLTVHYDLMRHDADGISREISRVLGGLASKPLRHGRLVEVPVWYAPEVGPDLLRVAQYHQVSTDEVIQRHSGCVYTAFAIGFAPGFAYLGRVDEAIATPRLATPRAQVPVGSVAIADRQTAVYPRSTPGGWNIVGRTPMSMFDRSLAGLCPVTAGDQVRFIPMTQQQFLDAGGVVHG